MDEFEIMCPWCGEMIDIGIESDVMGEMIQDCEVCCNPILLYVSRDSWGDADLDVKRAE